MVTRRLFAVLVGALAIQRLIELRLSWRNEARIRAQGGQENASDRFRLMKALHTAWFMAMVGEVFGKKRPFIPALSLGALLLLALGQSMRYTAIRTLGWRWTVRVMIVPGAPPVKRGIYRHIRHPNYLGVMLEILAVPLLHTAYWTAAFFSLANGLLLRERIRAEEQALREWKPGSSA